MFEFEFDKELSTLLQTLKKPSLLNNFQLCIKSERERDSEIHVHEHN